MVVTLSNGKDWSGPVIVGCTETVIIDHWMQKRGFEKRNKGELELWPLIIDALGERKKLATAARVGQLLILLSGSDLI